MKEHWRKVRVAAAQDWTDELVEPVKDEVKRKVDGLWDNVSVARDQSPRWRLFMEGGDETKIGKDKWFMSLPIDSRVADVRRCYAATALRERLGLP